GVVHRDLKPANVLLGGGGAQLADFGIARLEAEMLTGPMVTRLTETAAVLGTLPYMSPEQRRGGAVDRRSDLFSAGVMLYEAATDDLPEKPAATNGATKRLGKIKRRVVLKTVAEVKKLRKKSTKSEAAPDRKKTAARIDPEELDDLKRSGKLDKLIKAGKPIPEVFKGENDTPDAGADDEPPPTPPRKKK